MSVTVQPSSIVQHVSRRALASLVVLTMAVLILSATAQAANFSVSNTNDIAASNPSSGSCATPSGSAAHGACTLRSAIQAANNVSGASTISLAAGTYKLTIPPSGPDDDSTGDLNITGSLTINGAGASSTVIDGNFLDRVINLGADATATISGVTIKNGRPGGIGPVTDCPSQPATAADGGGIVEDGTLTLNGDVVTNNIAAGGGGGIEDRSGALLTVSGTTISNNKACQPPFFGPNGGGGIDLTGGGDAAVNDSTISGNTALPNGSGGGIEEEFVADPTTITSTTISGNSAFDGGGVGTDAGGSFHFFADTLNGNHAANGGGGVEDGGGDTNTYVNTTITGNSTDGDGGGVWSANGTDTLSYSTVTSNHAGSGVGNLSISEAGTQAIDDTIVVGGTGSSGSPSDCSSITDNGYNLIDSSSQCGADPSGKHDVVTTDPKLGPLANNGGPTQTQALLTGSPAIDHASLGLCSETANGGGQKVDERGVTRPQGPNCDIGAFEYAAADLAITKTASPQKLAVGKKVTYTLTVTNNGPDSATGTVVTDKLPHRVSLVSATAQQGTCFGKHTVACQLGTVAVGAHVKITIVVRVHHGGRISNTARVSGTLPDPNPANNAASAAVKAKAAACTVTLHSFYDRDDHVVRIDVFINGTHTQTLHRNKRKVTLSIPSLGTFEIRVVFTLHDTRQGIVKQSFTNCVGGPSHRSSVNPESAPSEP